MPGDSWCFAESPTGGCYISVDGVVLSKYGTVKDIAPVSSDKGIIKVNFFFFLIIFRLFLPPFQVVLTATEKIKSMKLAKFKGTDDFNKEFDEISTSEMFIRKFQEVTNLKSTIQSGEEQPSAKRQKLSAKKGAEAKGKTGMDHPIIFPATRRMEPIPDEDTEFDEDEMDTKIQDHYLGN